MITITVENGRGQVEVAGDPFGLLLDSMAAVRMLHNNLEKIKPEYAEWFIKACKDGGLFNSTVTNYGEVNIKFRMEGKDAEE